MRRSHQVNEGVPGGGDGGYAGSEVDAAWRGSDGGPCCPRRGQAGASSKVIRKAQPRESSAGSEQQDWRRASVKDQRVTVLGVEGRIWSLLQRFSPAIAAQKQRAQRTNERPRLCANKTLLTDPEMCTSYNSRRPPISFIFYFLQPF